MYHAIGESLGAARAEDPLGWWYLMGLELFASQMDYLANAGKHGVSVEELIEERTAHDKAVGLTFDDGHESHYRLVIPLLKKYGFRGTFFITTGRLGNPGYLTPHQVKEMSECGMEIGSHGVSHRPLSSLSRDELHAELIESKEALERIIRIPVCSLSLPGGFGSSRVYKAAHDIGYQYICTSAPGWVSSRTALRILPRLSVEPSTPWETFCAFTELRSSLLLRLRLRYTMLAALKRCLGYARYRSLWSLYVRWRGSESSAFTAGSVSTMRGQS